MNTEFSFKDVKPDMSDYPSYASLDEAVLCVVEANEIMFNNLKRNIGLTELGIFESTGNTIEYTTEMKRVPTQDKVVNKGGDLKAAVLKVLASVAARVKGLFEAALRRLSELTAKASAAFGKRLNTEKLTNAYNNLSSPIKFNSGDYENLKDFINGNGDLYVHMYSDSNEDIEALVKDDLGGELSAKKINEYFEGSKYDQTFEEKDIKDIVDIISNFAYNNNAVKNMYKDCSKDINKLMKEVKSAKEIDSEKLNRLQKNAKVTTMVFGSALSMFYKLVKQDVSIAIKLVNKSAVNRAKNAASDKAKAIKNAPKNMKQRREERREQKQAAADWEANGTIDESAISSYTEEVESLFNWSF